jgi:uncharacterized protein YuzE
VIAEYDPEAKATYVAFNDRAAAHTVGVTDLVMVDVDAAGEPVGVEFAMQPDRINDDVLAPLVARFPELRALADDRSWLLISTA